MKERNINLDIIRILAFLFVVLVHFFLNSGYISQIFNSKYLIILEIIHSFLFICVPLFIMLTGYLMKNKKLSKKYYKGIIRILFEYIISFTICFIIAKFIIKSDLNLKLFIKYLIGFKGVTYGWYLEMYLSLFLLIPFLNILYSGLNNKKDKEIMLITMIVICSIPNLFNVFKFGDLSWFMNPSGNEDYLKILPSSFSSLYPIMYYFIGSYLSEYKLKLKKRYKLLILIIVTILFGLFNYWRCINHTYIFGLWNAYSSPFVLIISVLFFDIINSIEIKKINGKKMLLIQKISNAIFVAYIVSWGIDKIVYTILIRKIPIFIDRIKYAPICVLITFFVSILIGLFIEFIYKKLFVRGDNK